MALGIAPGTPSQVVIDHLTAAGNALAGNNRALALAALSGPTFTIAPEEVLARLSNLPFLGMANIATTHAVNEVFNAGTDDPTASPTGRDGRGLPGQGGP